MKQLIILLVISIGLFSCATSSDSSDKENLELVEKFMHAVEANDIETMSSLLADDYKGYGPSVSDSNPVHCRA